MFKILKRAKKSECYGDRYKLSEECHECEVKSECLDHINSRISGTILLPCKSDKPLPIPNPQPHPLEYKKPPVPNWTLEKAREDYIKTNKECKRCKFSDSAVLHMECKVKQEVTFNYKAEDCKYYTMKVEVN